MMRSKSTQYAVNSSQLVIFYCALLTAYCSLFLGCAQIVNPDGGPKDVTPPFVVDYAPDSAATNFTGNKIVIQFDEYIALNDLNKQLIISPALKRKPEISVRKKDLIIEFKDTLAANTTYSISFGKSIRDITENNVLGNFRYVFSTGDYIDSLTCRGTVVNALTLRGEKNVLVMLYRNTSDSVPYKEKPYYYTRTDDNGNFTLTNLAPAKYKIFALADEGEDYLFNSKEERIAFSDSLIDIRANVDSVRLLMFKEKPVKQSLTKGIALAVGVYNFTFNLPVEQPSVTFLKPLPAGTNTFFAFSTQGDTLTAWFDKLETDSVFFVFNSKGIPFDTVPMKVEKPKQKTGKGESRSFIITDNLRGGKLIPGTTLRLNTNNPIMKFDSSKVVLVRGKDTLRPETSRPSPRSILFTQVFEEDSTYRLYIAPGAIVSLFGEKNDSIVMNFSLQPARQFGNLSVKIPELAPGNYVLQLLDDRDNIVRDTLIKGPANCSFNLLTAGNYRVRLIVDSNKDQRWTPGNYSAKLQPERVIYYSAAIRVRAGWDMDVEWRFAP